MEQTELQEQVLSAWIGLNALLKDSQMTDKLTYNEAIVMKVVYDNYRADGIGRTPVQKILTSTNLLKSLMNRTLNSLCTQGFLAKEKEGRNLFVIPLPERIPDFMAIHAESLALVQKIISVIGTEDAAEFARICGKLASYELNLERNENK